MRRKLTNKQVRWILYLLKLGYYTQRDISQVMGISHMTVNRIAKGHTKYAQTLRASIK